jgi:hypothetical protein
MYTCRNRKQFGILLKIIFGISVLVISSIACAAPFAASEVQEAPAAPVEMPPAETVPTATQAQEAEAPAPVVETVSLDQGILGFWRTKVPGKEIMVFEFIEGGKTIWNYHYSNGQTRNTEGTYSIKDNIITVDMGSPQDLNAALAGDQLTITGPDNTPMIFRKVQSADSPSPDASTNVSQDIIGKWQDPKTQEWIEFKGDGSVSITNGSNTVAGTYTVTNTQLEMKLNDQAQQPSTFTVEIEGDTLAMIGADGSFVDYSR